MKESCTFVFQYFIQLRVIHIIRTCTAFVIVTQTYMYANKVEVSGNHIFSLILHFFHYLSKTCSSFTYIGIHWAPSADPEGGGLPWTRAFPSRFKFFHFHADFGEKSAK